jgi:hypothetical protein
MDILGKSREVSMGEYELASIEAIADAWLEYEATRRDRTYGGTYQKRAYYADDREIFVAVDIDREFIFTCYHEHYDRGHVRSRNRTTLPGERRERYLEYMEFLEVNGLMDKPTIIRP